MNVLDAAAVSRQECNTVSNMQWIRLHEAKAGLVHVTLTAVVLFVSRLRHDDDNNSVSSNVAPCVRIESAARTT